MTTNEPPQDPDDSGDSTPSDPSSTPSDAPDASGPPSYGSTQPPAGGAQPPAGETPPAPPPPPSAPPPAAPGGSVDAFNAPDAIGWGWRKFTEKPGPIVVAGVVWFVAFVALNVIGRSLTGQSGFGMSGGGFSLGGLIFNIVQNVVMIVIGAAIARAALDVVDGQPFDFGAAFGKLNIVNVIIAALLVSIIVSIGVLLLVIPGIVAYFLTYFTTLYVVDDDATSPVTAIQDSVKLISNNVGDSLLLALLNVLVLIVGTIALGVGLVVAYPVVLLASAYAYRSFRGQPVAA